MNVPPPWLSIFLKMIYIYCYTFHTPVSESFSHVHRILFQQKKTVHFILFVQAVTNVVHVLFTCSILNLGNIVYYTDSLHKLVHARLLEQTCPYYYMTVQCIIGILSHEILYAGVEIRKINQAGCLYASEASDTSVGRERLERVVSAGGLGAQWGMGRSPENFSISRHSFV